jgi:hypothetical protein
MRQGLRAPLPASAELVEPFEPGVLAKAVLLDTLAGGLADVFGAVITPVFIAAVAVAIFMLLQL